MTQAAREFVRDCPPTTPCIAEYGEQFPEFMAECIGADRVPYLRCFATLEWHLGHVALAIEHPCLAMDALAAVDGESLPDIVLTLQPGLKYLEAPWPLDDLMNLFLTEADPNQYVFFEPADVRLEVRGARGAVHIERLDVGAFVFRRSILQGQSIGAAAEYALETDPIFEPGQALTRLVSDRLVTAFTVPQSHPAR